MCITDIDHMMLSSFRCDFDDTAQYRVSAMNAEGELSAFASVVVKSMFLKPSHTNALHFNKHKNFLKRIHHKSILHSVKVKTEHKCHFKTIKFL